jgi:RNA polymerase sigma factor (sigma-70 family)
MKADAKGASGQSRQGIGKGTGVDNHDGAADLIVAALYVAHRQALEVYLRRFVNEHDAQDIVHEVFMNLLRSRPTWITSQDARRFLFVTAHSKALNLLHKLARCDSRDSAALDSIVSDASSQGETTLDELQALLDARLAPDLQRVIRQRLKGSSLLKIAEIEGISLASLNRRLLKARRILRILLKKNEPFSQSQLKYE